MEDGGKQPALEPIRVAAAAFETGRPFEQPRDQGSVEVLWPGQVSRGDLRPRERSGQGVGHRFSFRPRWAGLKDEGPGKSTGAAAACQTERRGRRYQRGLSNASEKRIGQITTRPIVL